jgi:plasmid maintenance system killer protein
MGGKKRFLIDDFCGGSQSLRRKLRILSKSEDHADLGLPSKRNLESLAGKKASRVNARRGQVVELRIQRHREGDFEDGAV